MRISVDGELRESSPCKHCAAAIKQIGIKRIQYSTNEGTIISVLNRDIDVESHPPSSGYRDHLRTLAAI